MNNVVTIRSGKSGEVKEKRLIVSVDIAGAKHTGYYRCPDGSDITPFDFANSTQGFNLFWKRIEKARKDNGLKKIVVGYEPTGPYAEPLAHFLSKKGVNLVQVNPMHTKRLKELQGNSPLKTDPKDAKVIADIIGLGHALTVVIPQGAAADLRRLSLARERALARCNALNNQLQDLVYITFPEFIQVMRGIRTKTARHLLFFFTTPCAIAELGPDKLADIVKQVSRGKIKRDRGKQLWLAAKNSVGIQEGLESIALEMKELLSLIDCCEQFIAKLTINMEVKLIEVPYSRYLLSLKGVSTITTAGMIGEVGDFKRFKTIREIIKYAGLNLYEISSGKQQRGDKRISKRGRHLMRKLLFFASLSMVKKGGIMHRKYRDYLDRGMPKIKALVAIMRKLLILMFALVRDANVYIENYQEQQKIQYQLKEVA
jgi:transposase|tara:strand:- start:232 stop:1515 length:1284 start_codon:yes stop_codon:yes gene_type:complete